MIRIHSIENTGIIPLFTEIGIYWQDRYKICEHKNKLIIVIMKAAVKREEQDIV